MNVIDYFDQARIISMLTRKDRRDETLAEFTHKGFQINANTVKFFDAIAPKESNGFTNPGVQGCFLSHLTILEEAHHLKANNVLILEDDIQFSKHINTYGNRAIESLKEMDWDIAYFGHTLKSTPNDLKWKAVSEPMQLSHFYAINGKAIGKFIHCLTEIKNRPAGHPDGGPMHYDGALSTIMHQNSDIKAYYYSVNLGFQRASKTDLHKPSFFDSYAMFKPMVSIARKVKRKVASITR